MSPGVNFGLRSGGSGREGGDLSRGDGWPDGVRYGRGAKKIEAPPQASAGVWPEARRFDRSGAAAKVGGAFAA